MTAATPGRSNAIPTTDLLLIHGAWQGAWVWDALTPLLTAAGYTVDAPDLPDRATLDDYVAFLSVRLPHPAIVIGHSGGGVVASQLAEARPDSVLGLVYLAGIMLPSGTGFSEVVAPLLPDHPEASGISPFLQWSADRMYSTVPPEAACDIFLQDVPREAAMAAGRRLTPQYEPGRSTVPHLTAQRFGAIPRLYVEALHDRSVVLAAQRRMQALTPGADIVSLPTGHAPHVADPAATAAAILPWLRALEYRTR